MNDTDRKDLVVPLHAEQIEVDRVKRETARVRIETVTHQREHVIDEALSEEHVEVRRVDVGRVVDAMPEVREEGDTTVIPVVEEVLVVEKRLLLKEEVHITKIRTTTRHQESVLLRKQEAVVTRSGPGISDDEKTSTSNKTGDHNGD